MTRSFFKDSGIMMAGTVVTAVLSYVYSIYLARTLGPAGYGEVGALLSILYVLAIAVGPVATVVTKFAAEYTAEAAPGKLATLLDRSLVRLTQYGLPITLLLATASPLVFRLLHLSSPVLAILTTLHFFLTLLLAVPRSILQGQQRFVALTGNQVLEATIRLVLGVVGVQGGGGPFAAIGAYVAGTLVAFGICLATSQSLRHVPRDEIDLPALFRFAGPVFFTAIYFSVSSQLDTLVVKSTFPPREAGIYIAVTGLAKMTSILATPINLVAFPRYTALAAAGQNPLPELKRTLAVLSGGFGLGIIVAAVTHEPLIQRTVGPQYLNGAWLLAPYLGVLWLQSLLGAYTGYALALNQRWFLRLLLAGLAMQILWLSLFHNSFVQVLTAITGPVTLLLVVGFIGSQRPTNQPF